jgi:2-oxo-4-hydroxy-4-carboxy-5-ureidoimidazoline decarboxylase
MTPPLTIAAVNALDRDGFVARFGDIAEHSPWVAEVAAGARPYAGRGAMVAAFAAAVEAAGRERQLTLLRAHPDLAGRAKLADLAADSRSEQRGAGLDRLTAEEMARFTAFNDAYKARNGFPFILAVKGATKETILAAFAARLDNPAETEFKTALQQVARIIRFRLEERVEG